MWQEAPQKWENSHPSIARSILQKLSDLEIVLLKWCHKNDIMDVKGRTVAEPWFEVACVGVSKTREYPKKWKVWNFLGSTEPVTRVWMCYYWKTGSFPRLAHVPLAGITKGTSEKFRKMCNISHSHSKWKERHTKPIDILAYIIVYITVQCFYMEELNRIGIITALFVVSFF